MWNILSLFLRYVDLADLDTTTQLSECWRMCEYRGRPLVVNRTNRERDSACAPARGMRALAYLNPSLPGPAARQPSRIVARAALGPSTPAPPPPGPLQSPLCCFATPLRRVSVRAALVRVTHYAVISFGDVMSYTTLNARCVLRTHARTNVRARAALWHVHARGYLWKRLESVRTCPTCFLLVKFKSTDLTLSSASNDVALRVTYEFEIFIRRHFFTINFEKFELWCFFLCFVNVCIKWGARIHIYIRIACGFGHSNKRFLISFKYLLYFIHTCKTHNLNFSKLIVKK